MRRLPLFVYLHSFDAAARSLLDERTQHVLELSLLADPDAGDILRGAGGVRKLRIAVSGSGKRGGARVIYYYRRSAGRIYLLFIYGKHQAATLSDEGKSLMRTLVRQLEEAP